MLKKILLSFSMFIICMIWFSSASLPYFEKNEVKKVGYDIEVVRKDMALKDNIMNLFFPGVQNGWIIWEKLRVIAVWLLLIFLIRAWALFIMDADDDGNLKKAKNNVLYILYGAFLVFWSIWLLWSVLNVGQDATNASNLALNTENWIIWNILIFFKAAAYFLAIVMMVYYGYQIIQAQEKEDKIKAGKTGALNIIIALVAIKVLDYIYFIAQERNLKGKAWDFLVWTWKILGWILWVILVLALLYAAVLLITSRWNEESWKKAKTIVRNIFLVVVVLFLFIVIVYDLVKNFAS